MPTPRVVIDPVAGDPDNPWVHGEADLGAVTLHYVTAGEGPLVILLHGFPEFWYSWRYQIPALAAAGYRVVAPSMRGYGRSSKPGEVEAYGLEPLVADVEALIDHLGEARASVVGHDWGGVVAWAHAMAHPDRLHRLGVVNAPHPALFRRALKHPAQFFRSWYVLFFQVPWLPERLYRSRDYGRVQRVLSRDIDRPEVLAETDFSAYVEALSQPGALTGMINYYRAAVRGAGRSLPNEGRVEVPTLVVWGERDRYLRTRLLEGLDGYVPRLWVERIPEAGHFVHQEAHERVTERLRRFLEADLAADAGGSGTGYDAGVRAASPRP